MSASVDAVERSLARRVETARTHEVRFRWFIDEVCNKVGISMRKRVRIATQHLQDRIVQNISRPVTKTHTRWKVTWKDLGKTRSRSGYHTIVTNRSKPGEFPKADTVQLLKTIFNGVVETRPGCYDGFVGTPLDYGLFLELKMERQFLTRTLHEEQGSIIQVLTGPLK